MYRPDRSVPMMIHQRCTALLSALDALGATQGELAKILARRDELRRPDLVGHRRALAIQAAKVNKLGAEIFDALDDPVLSSEFRRLVSIARSKTAYHQADWSAASVGEFELEYRKSAREAGEANFLLSDWLRGAIADIIKR